MRAFSYLKSLAIERSCREGALLFRKSNLGSFNQKKGIFCRRKLFSVITVAPEVNGLTLKHRESHLSVKKVANTQRGLFWMAYEIPSTWQRTQTVHKEKNRLFSGKYV